MISILLSFKNIPKLKLIFSLLFKSSQMDVQIFYVKIFKNLKINVSI
jgi:hypothetical protein